MTIEVPGYQILKLLGEGGMASVYLATQQSLDRHVALKVLKKFDSEAQVQRFFNEGKIIASLNQRNIITIHDLGEVDGRCFLAMEYLEGGDLKQRIDTSLSPDKAVELIKQIAQSLDFVHKKGVIHRDIKPENILFRKDGSPVLTDFGVAKQLQTDSSLTMDGSAIGSPYYLSPEQAEQKALDPRTDIYSLGIVFYEMLTRQKPFQGDSPIEIIIAHLTTEAAPLPDELNAYQTLLNRMIAKNVGERFASAAELIKALESIQHTEGISGPISQTLEGFTASRQVKKILNKYVGFGLAGAVAISTVSHFQFNGSRNAVLSANVLAESPRNENTLNNDALAVARQNEIQQILTKAANILGQKNVSLPDLKEAYDLYNQALDLDGGHVLALKGANRVASMLTKTQNEIDFNLSEADRAISAFRLTKPANDNAMHFYQKVLTLDPDNEIAHLGKFKVANAYADLAEANLQNFKYDQAKANLDKGLSLDPQSTRLLALKEQTNVFADAPKRLFGKIKSIFD